MKIYKNLYWELCSEENIELAFRKARKRKTLKPYVLEFEKDKEYNLNLLRQELLNETYQPRPLRTFIVREPKTRKMRKANLRNVSRQILKKGYDSLYEYLDGWFSYANHANTYNLRNRIADFINTNYLGKISLLEIDRWMKYA